MNKYASFLTKCLFYNKAFVYFEIIWGILMKKKDSDLKVCSASPPRLTRKREREHHSLLYQNPFDCMLVLGERCSEMYWRPRGTNWSLCGTSDPTLTNCCAASLFPFLPKARGMYTSNTPCSRNLKMGLQLSSVLHPLHPRGQNGAPGKHFRVRVTPQGRGGVLGPTLCRLEERREMGAQSQEQSTPAQGPTMAPIPVSSHPTYGGISTHLLLPWPAPTCAGTHYTNTHPH